MSLDDFGFVGHRADGSQFHAGAGPTPESEIHGYGLVGFGRYSKGPSLSTLPGFFFPRVHVTSVPHLHPDRGSTNGRGFPGVEAIITCHPSGITHDEAQLFGMPLALRCAVVCLPLVPR